MTKVGACFVLLFGVVGCKFAGSITSAGGSSSSPSTSSSSGPSAATSENLTVPNVMFMTRAEAEATLARAGFRAPSIDDHSICGSVVEKQIVELGRVCHQHPPAGRQQGGRIPVSIRVQTENPYGGDLGGGRRWFLMPDLVGQHVDKARATLKQLGFVTKEVKLTDSDDPSCKPNIVCKSYPERMTRTDTASDKLFYVGKAPDLPKPPASPLTPGQPLPPATPTPTPTPKPSMGDAF